MAKGELPILLNTFGHLLRIAIQPLVRNISDKMATILQCDVPFTALLSSATLQMLRYCTPTLWSILHHQSTNYLILL